VLSVGQDRVEELFELERPHIVAGSLLDCQAPQASGWPKFQGPFWREAHARAHPRLSTRSITGNLSAVNSRSIAGLVRRFYEGWNSGSIDFADLVAEDIVNHQPSTSLRARARARES
jgi:hypothetical protein